MHSSSKHFWLKSLLRSWSSRRRTQTARPRPGARIGIEALEERLTPSTYTVTDASDTAGSSTDVTLRYAITQAVSNNDQSAVISFSSALAGQTITLSQNDTSRANIYGPTAFVVNNAKITVDGSNAPGLILSGNNALRLFAVTGTGSLTLENLTVEDGLAAGGAGGASGGGMGGSAGAGAGGGGAGLGGAVYEDGGAFSAAGVTFANNTAHGGAGGSVASSPTNTGGGGGGLGIAGNNGTSGGVGGGSGGNGASGGAGGAGGFGGGGGGSGGSSGFSLGALQGGIGGFGGGGGGGGYGNIGGFGGGRAGSGGHGSSGGGGGGGAGLGGGIFAKGGTLTLTNDTFINNTAGGGTGGGGGGTAAGTAGNAGTGLGGAVFVCNGSLTATFDTFSGNTAAQGGTDVYVLSDGASAQASATLVDDILGQTANAVSDFVANTNGGGTAPNLTGSSNDLVRVNGGLPNSAVVSSADPMLSPPANNGGPTRTMALQAGSPAIGAGIAVSGISTDQRGLERPAAPSLGAFEAHALLVTTTTASNATAIVSGSDQIVTLTASVTSGGGVVNGGMVNFAVKQGNVFLGAAVPGTVRNGQASVNYTLPAGTPAGTYSLVADYFPGPGFTASPDSSHTLTVNAVAPTPTPIAPATTATQLTAVHIVPNLLNGTAQVTLTAQVSSSAGTVNEGNVTFTFAGHSAQAAVRNGTASVQLTVSLLDVIDDQTVSLAYTDNGSNASFSPDGAAEGVALNLWNVLLPADATFAPGGGEIDSVPFGSTPLEFVYVNQQLTELRFALQQVQLDFLVSDAQVRVTFDGTSFQVPLSTLLSLLNGNSSNSGSSNFSSSTLASVVLTQG